MPFERYAVPATGDADRPEGLGDRVPVQVRGWHASFWLLIALSLVYVAVNTEMSTTERVLGTAGVVPLGVAYAGLVQGRRPFPNGWRALVYLTVAVASVGTTAWVSPALSIMLFIVYPQVWMLVSSLSQGVVVSVAVTLSTLIGYLLREGMTASTLRDAGPQLAVALLFSVLMGVWITRIVRQSVERAELIEQLRATRTELSEAEHARGVMAERERMAREIHDTLAQGFTSIVMLAQAAAAGLARDPGRAAERLAMIEDVARENLDEARALVAAFSPVGLENSTLPDAVRRLAERFARQTGLEADLEVSEEATSLDRGQEVVLLRAVQEALTNVRRHAGARRVTIRLLVDGSGGRVEVDDDGVGFTPEGTAGGYGLAGMRGRVADVGGSLDVASAPGHGTRVTVQVPGRGTGESGGSGGSGETSESARVAEEGGTA